MGFLLKWLYIFPETVGDIHIYIYTFVYIYIYTLPDTKSSHRRCLKMDVAQNARQLEG